LFSFVSTDVVTQITAGTAAAAVYYRLLSVLVICYYWVVLFLVNGIILCDRLCAYDPHGLYQRVECLSREYMVKRKSCLTQLYMSPPTDGVGDGDSGIGQTSASVSSIVSALLLEYDGLKHISEAVSRVLLPLVRHQFTAVEIERYCNRELVNDT